MRNEKRYEDIDEILAAGIDVISTVNVQHLESLNDAIFELTGVRVRETFPDRILDEADEVVLVDLTPEALQERLRAGKVYPQDRAEVALQNFFRLDNLAALRELALREVAEDVEARRQPTVLDPLSQQAVAERVLALVEPQPKSQRILRRAWRSAQRLGARDRRALGAPAGRRARPTRRRSQLAALRRLASRPRHPLPRGGGRRPRRRPSGASSRERGSTYIFVGTPDESPPARDPSAARCSRGWCASCPGIDIRVVADRADCARSSSRDRAGDRARRGSWCARRGARPPQRRRGSPAAAGARRILVPFTGGKLDPTVLDAAIRIARAEDATLVPAYLLVVPLELAEDAPLNERGRGRACRCSRRSSTPRSAPASRSTRASRSGRTPIHALQRLWDVERFDRIVAPAPTGRQRASREGAAVDAHQRAERDAHPQAGAGRADRVVGRPAAGGGLTRRRPASGRGTSTRIIPCG